MTRTFRSLYLALLLACTSMCANVVFGEGLEIAVVEIESIINQLPEKQELEAGLKDELHRLQEEVDKDWNAILAGSEDLADKQEGLSPEGIARRQNEMISKEAELGEYWNKTAEKIKRRTEEVAQGFSKKVEQQIAEFARQNSYDLVFDRASGKLIYAAGHLNQTQAVLDQILSESRTDENSMRAHAEADQK